MHRFPIVLLAISAYAQRVHDAAAPERLLPLYEEKIINLTALDSSPELFSTLVSAGRFAEVAGRSDLAQARYRRALEIAADPSSRADMLERLAEVSPPADRLGLLETAIEERRKAGSPAGLAALYRKRGELLAAGGDRTRAVDQYRLAVDAAEKAGETGGLAGALVDLGFELEQREQFAEAASVYRRALGIQEKALGRSHPEVAITLNNLAGVTGAQGDLGSAEQMLRRALGILEGSLGPYHARVAVCLGNLADLLAATNRTRLARPFYERALDAYRRLGDREGAGEVERSLAALR